MSKKIIILASERSGTNLLRVLLGKHKDLSAAVPVHFFNTFKSTIKYYEDLADNKNAKKLVSHFLESANDPFSDWKLNITISETVKKYNVNSFETAFNAMYQSYANQNQKKHYVVKDNDMFNYVELIDKLKNKDNEVYYIHLYRDPRDQVISWLRTPLFLHTSYDIALKWNKEQNKIAEIAQTHKVFKVSYEDLISDTKTTMSSLLKFIGIEIQESCFTTDSKNKESLRNELWKNLSQPIIKNNKKNYVGKLKDKELKIVETICKNNMLNLGYQLDTKANWKDYFNFYKKRVLPKQRIKSKRDNKKFYDTKMKDLKSKLLLLQRLKNEITNEK